jgi:hypothetical protein
MEDIVFKNWRLSASVIDSEVLRLDIETSDGTDITEVGYSGHTAARGGEPYALRFTTQKIEESHDRPGRGARAGEPSDEDDEDAGDGAHSEWPADEDETLYVRGWEVTAFADEEGMLNVEVQKGSDNEIFEVEPVESGVPLSSRVIVQLGAEEASEDEDEDEEDDEYEDFEDTDEFDDVEELGDYDDDLEDEVDEADEPESFSLYDDLFDRRKDDWY